MAIRRIARKELAKPFARRRKITRVTQKERMENRSVARYLNNRVLAKRKKNIFYDKNEQQNNPEKKVETVEASSAELTTRLAAKSAGKLAAKSVHSAYKAYTASSAYAAHTACSSAHTFSSASVAAERRATVQKGAARKVAAQKAAHKEVVQREYMKSRNRKNMSSANRRRKRRKETEMTIRKAKEAMALLASGGTFILMLVLIVFLLTASFVFFGNTAADDENFKIGKLAEKYEGNVDEFVVSVAQTQVGNKDGALYWEWYGFDEHVEWCACFTSWCLSWLKLVDDGQVPKFAVCDDGIAWFKNAGSWREPYEIIGEDETARKVYYTPRAGDVIFFNWDADGVSDHVGIVESYDGGIVKTIEGNSGEAVRRQQYRRGDGRIRGYGRIRSTSIFNN